MSTPSDLSLWLAEAGLRNLPLEEMVDGFARRLNAGGVPVARIFVGMNTLHPLVLARSLIWDRATGPATRFEFQHAEIDRPIMQQSPFAAMLRAGIFEQRLDLRLPPPPDEVPVFEELRGLGMTDWLGSIFPFGELVLNQTPRAEEGLGQLWLICSVAADRADGFTEAHLAALRAVQPVFALAVKAVTMRAVGHACSNPISAPIPRRACWPAPCSAARCTRSRRCCSTPTCATSRRWPTRWAAAS